MTSRELNRKWNKHGITIEYDGYELHHTAMHKSWIVSNGTYHEVVWSLEEADEAAEMLHKMSY